jgi:hypothetical protein
MALAWTHIQGTSSVSKREVFLFALVVMAACFITVELMYCAGRYQNPTFIGAELFGILLALFGTTVVVLVVRIKGIFRLLGVYFAICGVLVALRIVAFDVLLHAYANGFEKAAFSAAAPNEWHSLVPLAGTWLSGHVKTSFDDVLPPFTRRVYPNDRPYSGVYGDIPPDLRNTRVVIWWRGPTLCVGLELGKAGQCTGELYRAQYTNGMSIVIFRGG